MKASPCAAVSKKEKEEKGETVFHSVSSGKYSRDMFESIWCRVER